MQPHLVALGTLPLLLACSNRDGGVPAGCRTFGSQHYYNPLTVIYGSVFIGTGESLHDYSAATSNAFLRLDDELHEIWRYDLADRIVRGAAVVDTQENSYFVVQENVLPSDYSASTLHLYSVDRDGAFRWSSQIAGAPAPNVGMLSPALAANGTIYVAGSSAFAFDADGDVAWSVPLPDVAMNAPIIDDDGNLYFAVAGELWSMTPGGTVRWKFQAPQIGDTLSSPAFALNQEAVVIAIGATIYKVDTSNGIELWSFTPPGIGGQIRATPAIDDQDRVFVGTKNDAGSVLYAIEADGSAVLWELAMGADLYSSPTLADDGALYVGSEQTPTFEQSTLHVIDSDTGQLTSHLYHEQGAGTWGTAAALLDDGRLLVPLRDFVCSVQTGGGGLMSGAASPKFRGTNENSGTSQ